MEISALQAIINDNQEAEALVRRIFYKLQEKGAHNIFKKTNEATQCETEIQSLLAELQTAHCPAVSLSELRTTVCDLCHFLLRQEFSKNK